MAEGKKKKEKGEAPGYYMYVKEVLTDPLLRQTSPTTRGIWFDCLMYMWRSDERGKIKTTPHRLARMAAASIDEVLFFLNEARDIEFCDISMNGLGPDAIVTEVNCNDSVTIINRRMYQEYINRQNTRLRVRKHREKKAQKDGVTPDVTGKEESVTGTFPFPIPIPDNKEVPKGTSVPDPTKTPLCPHQKIIEIYHEIIPEMPRIEVWDETAEGWLRARWKSDPKYQNLEWWAWFFRFIRESPFLMGDKKDWMADLRWMVRSQNFAKILNGAYHKDIKPQDIKPQTYGQAQDAESRQMARYLLEKESDKNKQRDSEGRSNGATNLLSHE